MNWNKISLIDLDKKNMIQTNFKLHLTLFSVWLPRITCQETKLHFGWEIYYFTNISRQRKVPCETEDVNVPPLLLRGYAIKRSTLSRQERNQFLWEKWKNRNSPYRTGNRILEFRFLQVQNWLIWQRNVQASKKTWSKNMIQKTWSKQILKLKKVI